MKLIDIIKDEIDIIKSNYNFMINDLPIYMQDPLYNNIKSIYNLNI